ncbi:MAG: ACP S-malonyltransferase [Bacillota bacterium]
MAKISWVFPGQGAQFVGMGKELYESDAGARAVFQAADRALGYSLSGIIFEGPKEELTLTQNAQPALLTVSMACVAVLRRAGLRPDMVAGLSLGEYTALAAAGSLEFEDAVVLTHRRGLYMQEACPPDEGAMAAILGLSCAEVEALCYEARKFGEVAGANYNCPGQVVISGHKKAVDEVIRRAAEMGSRAIPLAVSAPFHCALMRPAAERLQRDLDQSVVRTPSIPVYSNVHGERVADPQAIRRSLVDQVTHPVLWQVDVQSMVRDGAGAFVEIGPGKTLSGFGKRIDATIPFAQFAGPDDLPAVLAFTREALLR